MKKKIPVTKVMTFRVTKGMYESLKLLDIDLAEVCRDALQKSINKFKKELRK